METNKKTSLLQQIKTFLTTKINTLKQQFDSPNCNCFNESKDYGHIAIKLVILQDILETIQNLEKEWEEK